MIDKILKENKNKPKSAALRPLITFVAIILLGLPFSAMAAYFLAFQKRVYPKILLCDTPLTGKNFKEVTFSIANILQEKLPEKILLTSSKETFFIEPKIINYLRPETARKSLKQGREKFLLMNLPRLINLLKAGENLSFDFQVENEKLESEIASIAAKLYIPALEPQIKIAEGFKDKRVIVEAGKNGQEVNLRDLKTKLIQNLACPQKEIVITIPINPISPEISEEFQEATKKRATSLLGKEIKLKLDNQVWTIAEEEIINFISFNGGFDWFKIEDFGEKFAQAVNLPPENATFNFEIATSHVVVFKPSKDGVILKQAEFAQILENKLDQLEKTTENQELTIPVIKIPPKISTANANSLGIKELIAKGTSLFRGSISERIHNIQLASLKLNGILVAPGEIFSFNQALGDVSQDTGFKQAYIIKEGRTILGDGGGVCQVSTTLFRAALNAGLPIAERHAHAYRVHYYEDDLGPGFDATVFDPTADLKFKNDTSAYILIQTNIDLKKKQLTFDLYGTKDDRKVEISKARVWDKQPPPPDLYQDDPTLPAGTTKQVDWKAWGSKAAFDYKVTRNGETLFEKTFTSAYKPWQAVYLRGTGK